MMQPEGIERVLREAAPSPVSKEQLLAGLEALGVSVHSKVPTRRAAIVAQRANELTRLGRLPIEAVGRGSFRWTGSDEAQA
jgi:hypothetical protein